MARALIVVDMQKDFVDGSLGTPEAVKIVPKVKEKILSHDGPLYFTMDTHAEDYLDTQEGALLPVIHCVRGTPGWQIVPELEPLSRDPRARIVEKETFASVTLARELKQLSDAFDAVELVGLCTDICVVSNALCIKAQLPEKPIYVDARCCAGVTPQKHEAALETMRSCQIRVLNDKPAAFDAAAARDALVEAIRAFLTKARVQNVVVGLSGGKDSTVAAALCARAIGPEHVYGIRLPNRVQPDLDDSIRVSRALGLNGRTVDIGAAFDATVEAVRAGCAEDVRPGSDMERASLINVAPRVRMTHLRYIAQALGALLCGTGNLSERTVGYCTKDGDTSCDFNPLGALTSVEVVAVGLTMPEIPRDLVLKTPTDGLSGMSDEEKLGLSYAAIHAFIRTGTSGDDRTDARIAALERASAHKRTTPPILNWTRA